MNNCQFAIDLVVWPNVMFDMALVWPLLSTIFFDLLTYFVLVLCVANLEQFRVRGGYCCYNTIGMRFHFFFRYSGWNCVGFANFRDNVSTVYWYFPGM